MKTCEFCEHWTPLNDSRTGICEQCTSHDGEPETKDSLAVAYDEECYFAQLVTRLDFGCVMFCEVESEEEEQS